MKKYAFDPFTIITESESSGRYSFISSNDPADIFGFEPNESQLELIRRLADGESIREDELERVLGGEIFTKLRDKGCLKCGPVDTCSMSSRTKAFFEHYGMENASKTLGKASVLILGCGGIGTHIAWHMLVMGVGKITLVDFDSVEESNFNRQILFDCSNIGKRKTEAIKDRLLAISPDADIRTIHMNISDESKLFDICSSQHFDLMIKALDTPQEFPLWLDHAADRSNIPYIAGITMQDKALIGPTYIPGRSKLKMSDMIPIDNTTRRIHGTSPSLGAMLYHISDCIAREAFKLLTGCGELQYIDRVVIENIFTNEVTYLGSPPNDVPKQKPQKSAAAYAPGMLLSMVTAAAAVYSPVFAVLTLIFIIFVSRSAAATGSQCIKLTFVNTVCAAIGIIGGALISGKLHDILSDPFSAIVSALAVLIGISISSLFMIGVSAITLKGRDIYGEN